MLSVARCPPSTADTLLPLLTQIPSIQDVINRQATQALLTNEKLFTRFVLPWCTTADLRRSKRGYQLRNYVNRLLQPLESSLQHMASAYYAMARRVKHPVPPEDAEGDKTATSHPGQRSEDTLWIYVQQPLHSLTQCLLLVNTQENSQVVNFQHLPKRDIVDITLRLYLYLCDRQQLTVRQGVRLPVQLYIEHSAVSSQLQVQPIRVWDTSDDCDLPGVEHVSRIIRQNRDTAPHTRWHNHWRR